MFTPHVNPICIQEQITWSKVLLQPWLATSVVASLHTRDAEPGPARAVAPAGPGWLCPARVAEPRLGGKWQRLQPHLCQGLGYPKCSCEGVGVRTGACVGERSTDVHSVKGYR